MGGTPGIADMPLYTNLDRVARGLAARGIGPDDPIPPAQLLDLDQWHYHGVEAVDAAIAPLGIGPGSRLLDVGSGVGGPARRLAERTGCHVTAVELQPELHAIAVDLTRRAGLDGLVTHVCGDALAVPLPEGGLDAVVSWLAVLHIPDRPRLLARLARALRPGGGCYIEDLCTRAEFAPDDLRDLREVVFGVSMSSLEDYAGDLRKAGFAEIAATDLTPDWHPFALERLQKWREGHEAYARVHGEGAYAAQERFYSVIARLYESGSLGGIRLVARKP